MKQHDFSLYIHIPWCIRKCPYCDFNSYQKTSELPEDEYIERLFADLEQDLSLVQGRTLSSIFFGGGTPSLFSPKSFETILNHVFEKVAHPKNIEIF
jgi:coproporphyrinogen III oxidase-like Fe-S oxidoreductase